VIRALGGGRSGTTIVDVAMRNAIRASSDEAAATLPSRPDGRRRRPVPAGRGSGRPSEE